MKTLHILITGKVQGVFFRETSRKVAEQLKIRGWIRNTPDGKVEAVITGEEHNVKNFVDWCKTGPEKAQVTDVIVSENRETFFEKFEVIRAR